MSDSPWRANLDWLRAREPQLQRLIFDLTAPGRLRMEAGRVCWYAGLEGVIIEEPQGAIQPLLDSVGPAESVVLMGVGTGDLLEALLEHTEGVITAWDRDPSFLRPALLGRDWTPWLASGRLRWARGADLLQAHGTRVLHPVLGSAYADEAALVGDGRPRALLVDGTLFVADVGEALRELGWDVFRWDVHDLPEAELRRTAMAFAPEVVFGINHTHGLAEACEAMGVPLVEWEIDPATDRLRSTRSRGAKVWTWRREQVAAYRDAGFEAHYLPLATNPARRRPVELSAEERSAYAVPVAYVGSSMVERGRELLAIFVDTFAKVYGDREAGASLADQLLELQARLAPTRGYVVPELLAQVSPELGERFAASGCRHRADALLGELAAARYRLEVLASIAPLGLHVWGDTGWGLLAQHGATYRGWAGHYRELTKIYSGAAVHVDVGRLYQLDIVPMRIVDTIASGGFVLAQHSEALAEILEPGVEVITWRSPDELARKTSYYLNHPEERSEVVRRGRARVLADHTIRARLERMLGRLQMEREVA